MTARPRGGADDVRLGAAHAEQVAAFQEAERRAVRVVASRAADAGECRELLGMLGLERAAGVAPLTPTPDQPETHTAAQPSPEPAQVIDLNDARGATP